MMSFLQIKSGRHMKISKGNIKKSAFTTDMGDQKLSVRPVRVLRESIIFIFRLIDITVFAIISVS
jgi:hypothetical protein